MTVKTYRKKPVEIQATQLTANPDSNAPEISGWVNANGGTAIVGADNATSVPVLVIETLEGTMRADVGDYIIRGVQGEFYPCKPDIFEATYEPVDPEPAAEYNPECDCPHCTYERSRADHTPGPERSESAGALRWSWPRVNTVRSAFSDWGIFPSGDRRGVTGMSVRFGHRGIALQWKGHR